MLDQMALDILQNGPGRDCIRFNALLRRLESKSSTEGTHFELKVDLKPGPESWAELAKDIVALANSGGGIVVFGVADDGQRVGLDGTLLALLDPSQVTDQIRRKAPGAVVSTTYHETLFYRKRYGCLCVLALETPLLFDTEWGYNNSSGKHKIAIRPGVLYVRTPGSSSPATQGDLRSIWQRTVDEAARRTMARIEQVAAMPLDAELIVTSRDRPDGGYVLASGGEGRPVRIVDDPSAPAVQLSEVLSVDVPFSSVSGELANQVRQWQQADPGHRVSKSTLNRWWQQRNDLQIDDCAAEFALLSAAEGRGHPMFWAAKMSRTLLLEVLERELSEASGVPCQVYPYVVGLFFWGERETILRPHLKRLTLGPTRAVEKVLASPDYDFFITRVKWESRLRWGDKAVRVEDLLTDNALATEIYAALVQRSLDGEITESEKGFARQVDLLVHADPSHLKA